MTDFLIGVMEFSPLSVVVRLILSALLGGTVGFERGRTGHPAGLRTHIIVCLGSCLTALIGLYSVTVLQFSSDPLRISAQVISGIGFLGVGTILISPNSEISGLTTAAGLWTTAAIGLAVGFGFYLACFSATILVIVTMTCLTAIERPNKKHSKHSKIKKYYLELPSVSYVQSFVDMADECDIEIEIVEPRTNIAGNVGIECFTNVGSTVFWLGDKDEWQEGQIAFYIEE